VVEDHIASQRATASGPSTSQDVPRTCTTARSQDLSQCAIQAEACARSVADEKPRKVQVQIRCRILPWNYTDQKGTEPPR
jgi:hypothetical protein